MAYFPDVSAGDTFIPNALLSNNVRRLVNTLNGFNAKPMLATGGMIRIQVYNNSSSVLKSGCAVNFSENGQLCDDAVPAEAFSDPLKPWGVIVNDLESKALGSCILCGPARVSLSGSGAYASPSKSNPEVFTRGTTGAPVIFASSGKGIVLLGASSQDNYDGPFALSYDTENRQLTVNAGYLLRNGEFLEVAEKKLSAQNGIVCVCSTIDSSGKWSTPEIKIATPGQYNYPIGSCEVSGDSVTICSFRVPVAILLSVEVCDTTE